MMPPSLSKWRQCTLILMVINQYTLMNARRYIQMSNLTISLTDTEGSSYSELLDQFALTPWHGLWQTKHWYWKWSMTTWTIRLPSVNTFTPSRLLSIRLCRQPMTSLLIAKSEFVRPWTLLAPQTSHGLEQCTWIRQPMIMFWTWSTPRLRWLPLLFVWSVRPTTPTNSSSPTWT